MYNPVVVYPSVEGWASNREDSSTYSRQQQQQRPRLRTQYFMHSLRLKHVGHETKIGQHPNVAARAFVYIKWDPEKNAINATPTEKSTQPCTWLLSIVITAHIDRCACCVFTDYYCSDWIQDARVGDDVVSESQFTAAAHATTTLTLSRYHPYQTKIGN